MDAGRKFAANAYRLTRSVAVLTILILFSFQTSCGTAQVIASPPASTKTNIPITNTPMPTQTMYPSQTPTPTPMINGTWSDEPPMLMPRSAHAVVSSDSTIYALAGTDDHGKPVLEVEGFDGKQWKIETTLPGSGLNAPTASIVGQRLYVVGGFVAVTNRPTDE